MISKEKGDIAVGQAIAYYLAQGYEVLLPIGDKRNYDLVIEKVGFLQRVQVKFGGIYKDGVCRVGLRITGGNRSGNSVKKYHASDFDMLFVFTGKGYKFSIPWKEISARNELTIDHKKYIKYQV